MKKRVVVAKKANFETVSDELSKELDQLRAEGYSIFGINEGDRMPNTFGTRIVDIFYE